ncbi:indole-3-glycerol phosphate synthase TrpC [Sporolactobacillus vineae]|uniref:indole-3-glycerol phosphate synthase TrpC n=1 Tax=Sporolactobacillus vineae TaxID=444463 RepID=UPI000287E45A|nr:indole-3-glycerol-phosphate synthase [Sporolactobacillus vineae]
MPESILDRIMVTKQAELEAFKMPERKTFFTHHSLSKALKTPNHQVGLIAEVKKASPSKGTFMFKRTPGEAASLYQEAGADAISVLTDMTYFHGSLSDLAGIRKTVTLPILRKDFIIDERQIEAADRVGADAILLIAAALDPERLYELYQAAEVRGMEALVEVHSVREADRILDLFLPRVMGANNRDLRTFATDLSVTAEIRRVVPKEVVFVGESGIHTSSDVAFAKDHGADALLVGEALVCADSIPDRVRTLFGAKVSRHASEA